MCVCLKVSNRLLSSVCSKVKSSHQHHQLGSRQKKRNTLITHIIDVVATRSSASLSSSFFRRQSPKIINRIPLFGAHLNFADRRVLILPPPGSNLEYSIFGIDYAQSVFSSFNNPSLIARRTSSTNPRGCVCVSSCVCIECVLARIPNSV